MITPRSPVARESCLLKARVPRMAAMCNVVDFRRELRDLCVPCPRMHGRVVCGDRISSVLKPTSPHWLSCTNLRIMPVGGCSRGQVLGACQPL
jgi:hypothetical protein